MFFLTHSKKGNIIKGTPFALTVANSAINSKNLKSLQFCYNSFPGRVLQSDVFGVRFGGALEYLFYTVNSINDDLGLSYCSSHS